MVDLKESDITNRIRNNIGGHFSPSMSAQAIQAREHLRQVSLEKSVGEVFVFLDKQINENGNLKSTDLDLLASYCVIYNTSADYYWRKSQRKLESGSLYKHCDKVLNDLGAYKNEADKNVSAIAIVWLAMWYDDGNPNGSERQIAPTRARTWIRAAELGHQFALVKAGAGLVTGAGDYGILRDTEKGKKYLEKLLSFYPDNNELKTYIAQVYEYANKVDKEENEKAAKLRDQRAQQAEAEAKLKKDFDDKLSPYKSFEVFYVCVDKYPAGGRSQSIAKLVAQLAANNYLEQMTKLIYDSRPNINCDAMNGNFDRSRITRDATDIVTGNSGNQLFIVKTSNQASVILIGRK